MKIKHVRKSAEFAEILKKGEKIRKGWITAFFRICPEISRLSAGVIVSKKTEPLATGRNYLRRIIYAVCGEKADRFKRKTEIVVRLDGPVKNKSRKEIYGALRNDLTDVLERISEKT